MQDPSQKMLRMTTKGRQSRLSGDTGGDGGKRKENENFRSFNGALEHESLGQSSF
jgi:hypothetical protein